MAKPTASCPNKQPLPISAPWLPARAYGLPQCCDSDCPYAPQLSPLWYGTVQGDHHKYFKPLSHLIIPFCKASALHMAFHFFLHPLECIVPEMPFPRVRHKVGISPHTIKPDIHSYPGMSVVLFYPLMEGSGIPIALIPFHHIILWNSALIMHHLCPNLVCKH